MAKAIWIDDLDDPWGDKAISAQLAARPKNPLRDHLEALDASSAMVLDWRRTHRPMATKVLPKKVIKALNRVGVRPVLMGAYGIGGYRSQTRSTNDVDVLVRKKDIKKSVRALHEAYPNLEVLDTPVVTRFIEPASRKPLIDIMKPTQKVFRLVFRHILAVGDTHDIPVLEMALISKFAAMVSFRRDSERKMQDAVDFIDIVKNNRSILDLKKLGRLAEQVYVGGKSEIGQIIVDIDAGKAIRV